MASRHLLLMGCVALVLTVITPVPSNAEFLKEETEDLVFEETASPPKWRTVNYKKLEHYNKQTDSLDSPSLQHLSYSSESETGPWNSAKNVLRRLKRGFWDWLGGGDSTSSTTTTEGAGSSTTEERRVTSDPDGSTTLSRETRSSDEVDEFNKTETPDNSIFSSYVGKYEDDDEDSPVTSGDASGHFEISSREDTPVIPQLSVPTVTPRIFNATPSWTDVFRVKMTVDEPWSEELHDIQSEKFKKFNEQFSKDVDQLFEETPGDQVSNVIEISRHDDLFKSIVTIDIGSKGFNDAAEIERVLRDQIEEYRSLGPFSSYKVSSDHFSLQSFSAPAQGAPSLRPCSPGDIECTTFSGEHCLANAARCNGTVECQNGLDEVGCPITASSTSTSTASTTSTSTTSTTSRPTTEETEYFRNQTATRSPPVSIDRCRADDKVRCLDGSTFICDDQICDGTPDCPDGDDEDDCPSECSTEEFMCDIVRCIPKRERCDGREQCEDRTDEQDCPKACDPSQQFECAGDRTCIDIRQRCDRKVDCPQDNSDELNCQYSPEHITCTIEEFRCREGICIDRDKLCDSVKDCADGADEENCDYKKCRTEEFRCNDGYCLPASVLCNGRFDCSSGEDERHCSNVCQLNEFQCRDGKCVYLSQKCDGFPDCSDGSDEDDCGNPVHCMANEFRCNDGSCVKAAFRCDNITDCRDGSDEQNCRRPECGSNDITCGDGKCVGWDKRCDGIKDCYDGADERNCPARCQSNEFVCDDRRCVHNSKRCDRIQDCADNKDEENCVSQGSEDPPTVDNRVSCPWGQFACQSGDQCVPQSAHCDNIYDCRDYSDESNCARNLEGLNLRTYPADQIIKEGREVVFQCRDEGPLRAFVRWSRDGNLPLPPGSRDINGRLEMPNIQLEHSGKYICAADKFDSSTSVSVYLKVEPFEYLPRNVPKGCGLNEATCPNGDCIDKVKLCDGRYDCTDGSDELRCNLQGCEPNMFWCENKKCVSKTWLCDGDDDCGDNSDERNCAESPPGSLCRYSEYQCQSNIQCIPKAFHCDLEPDCLDGSDEFGCSKPEILKPPPSLVKKQPGETFLITCTAVGTPTPEVVWRLNWNHIPSKCNTTSTNGHGTLICPNIQESDQGAYSCEALNNRGTTFAIPDTTLLVKSDYPVCPDGSFNELATRPEECIPCFCFGVSTSCKSADLFIYQLPPPLDTYKIVNVYAPSSGGIEIQKEDSQFQTSVQPYGRSGFQISLTDNELRPSYSQVYPYFALPENYHGNQLKSYGGYIKYTIRTDGSRENLFVPDVILSGNGYVLTYKGQPLNPGVENNVAVRFYPGSWYRVQPDTGKASREELMMALQNVDHLLIRTKYFGDGTETTITDISVDSAAHSNSGQGKAAFVEQCSCPAGYTGLSCEKCENDFIRLPLGPWLGKCEGETTCPYGFYKDPRDNNCSPCLCPTPGTLAPCRLDSDRNITCECPVGYEGRRCEKCSSPLYTGNPLRGEACRKVEPICDSAGSLSSQPDPNTGRCVCKVFATGPLCNQCQPNTFDLSTENQHGCIECFCMGINTTCTSSGLYRTQIVSVFTRDNQDFTLAQSNRLETPITDVQVNPSSQEIYFQQFNPGTYYWVLPSKFLSNRVTSYGGNLKYTLRYIPTPGGGSSPNNSPDVEIVGDNGVHLFYYNRDQQQPQPNRPFTVVVPLLEQYWKRVDGASANREQLMMALAELQNILIKATYTTNTQEAALISVSLDTATRDRNTGQSRAVEVELCNCPAGYRGTSCEECDAGYTRIEEGSYLGFCEPCSCNGFSTKCDLDTGRCMDCQGNTKGDKCEQCLDGYEGNPSSGQPCTPRGSPCNYCDRRGSISCEGNTCTCKRNVIGVSCSECRNGTFDLSESNLEGCIECYCSGVTSDCQVSNLYREAIPMQIVDRNHRFTLTDANRREIIEDDFILQPASNEIGYDFSKNQGQQRLFWSLPPEFLGNKVLSYGGNLNFTQRYSASPNHSPSLDIDVIIVGPSPLTISWRNEDLPRPDETNYISIPLKESKWLRMDTTVGVRTVSRAELMKVLSNVQAILIRATYSTHTLFSYLSDVSLDTAVSQQTGKSSASEVEVCRCPHGYTGTSCESCSHGFYQDFDNSCKKCPCNNNEEHCALGPQQQVICVCKSTFGGTYCDRSINELIRPTPGQPTISISITEPAVIVIEAGKDITFRCTGRSLVSSKPIDLQWSKDNGDLPRGRAFDDRQGVLWIRDVQASDTGTYVCTASDGFTFVTERALLNVGGSTSERPMVSVTPRLLDVQEGEPVEFRCEATGVPTPTLQWVGGRSSRLPPQSSFASGRFKIPYASLQDEGEYTCIASNSAGDDSETVNLYVRSAPVTSPPLPVGLTIEPQSYSGYLGDTVRLECRAANPRDVQLQWTRVDGELSPNARDSVGTFTIFNSQPSDSGIYTCTAVDRNRGTILQEVTVRIAVNQPQRPQPTISIDPPRQTVSQGSVAELRCITSEGPVQWSKAGDTLPLNAKVDGHYLRIEGVQVRDRGVYVCQVDGPGGLNRITSILEVERREAPGIELFPKEPQTVIEGGSALFQCHVLQGIPPPTIHWSRVDGKPLPRQTEQLPGGVLRFDKVSQADEGQYLCTADNQEGSATTVAQLQVHSLPSIVITPPGQSIMVSLGQRVYLDCRAYGRPEPMVSWTKYQPGYQFYDSQSVSADSPQGAVYEIKGATLEDEGIYTCKARNSAGEVEERVQLIVGDDQTNSGPTRGDIPSGSGGVYIPDEDYTVPLGGHVTIRCVAKGPQQISLDWIRRDQRPLSPSAQVSNGVLDIQKVQYSDSGDYACQGYDIRGDVRFSAVARLKVTEPMHIKLEPERQVVRPGDNAKITCTATGEPPIRITWGSANGQALPRSVRVRDGIIEFVGIRESDAGRYVCKADNYQGVWEASADVIVNENPRVSGLRAVDRNPSAVEGSSIQLRCDTPDYKEITWSREGYALPQRAYVEGPILRIDNLQLSDAGRYICQTTSYGSIAQDFIDLQVENLNAVELQIEPSSRDVRYGDTVDLRCLAVGPSDIKIYWSLASGENFPQNTRQAGEVLRITSATPVNSGNYRCTAIHKNSRIDKDYYLTVEDDQPTHDAASAETETADYGQTVNLKCDIDLEGPITYSWSKHGSKLPLTAEVSGPYLSISSVTFKDAGLYICSASNGEIQSDIPKIILVRGAVPFFTQAPNSYLALPTLSNGHLKFTIEITFKPENANGLILYNGQNAGGNGDFISFGIRDAKPEFRFDSGSGAGIVSGTEPLKLGEWHTVQLIRLRKQGTMYVDDNQFYTGDSKGRTQGLDLAQQLFLGGVPDFTQINKQNGFDTGFVGCISRLVINNKEDFDIMKEQKDSEGVTSCETCAVNPCDNNGICQEAPSRSGYMCLCPRGFSGLNCSNVGEPCFPGACGSGRCIDSDSGNECYCGLGKFGDHCEQDVLITEPSFSKNSYLAYPTPKALSKTKVLLRFNAADTSNGLLLYCSETEDGTGDFISLSIRDRHLEFNFDSGSGVKTLHSTSEVIPGQWYTVNAGLSRQKATLLVTGDNQPVSQTFKPEMFKFTTPMYVGGYDKQRLRLAAAVGVRQGFSGCVGEVQVTGLNLDLIRSVVDSANIDQCSSGHTDPCQVRPCQHDGVCRSHPDGHSYICTCRSGYSGTNCESEQDMCAALRPCQNGGSCLGTPNSYKCNCPMGYAGPTCEERTQFRTEVQFNGDAFVELSRNLLNHANVSEPETIIVEFSTNQSNGLLLWHGQSPDVDGRGQDYLSLAVVNGFLQFSYELGSKPAVITSSHRVDDGKRHKAIIKRQGKDGSIVLDEDFPVFGESQGILTQLNANGNIYVGGLPNLELMTDHNSSNNFVGCIHSLQIQQSGKINFAETSVGTVNVLPCSSTDNSEDDYDAEVDFGRGEEVH